MRIKRSLQRGPKYPKERKTPRPKAMHQEAKTRRSEKQPATRTRSHHGWTVVTTTARGGCLGQTVVVPTAVVAGVCSCSSGFLVRRFVFQRFCVFAYIFLIHLDLFDHPIHSHFDFHFHSFRLVLERERGSGEELRGFHAGLRSKDGNAFLDELFFPFSSLFSI